MGRNIAVILAGGIGSRSGLGLPKQFFKVAGKTVIEHTVNMFDNHSLIDEIAIVTHPLYNRDIEDMVIRNKWKKVKRILAGGTERYESSLAAINAYGDEPDCSLIFHDAVRPLISNGIINDIITALETYNAIDVAVPATDTIIQVDEKGETIEQIPDRRYLRRGQTPQAFRQKVIKKAYDIALKDPNFTSSDDCGTVVKYLPQEKVYVVKGEESNMKLTYKEDSYLLDKLFQLRSTTVSGEVDFSTLKGKVLVVFGGNSGIGAEVVAKAIQYGANAYPFSRSTTGTDIADRKAVSDCLKKVFDKDGHIDYVVNSAAILVREPLVTMNPDVLNTMIRTNYDGMVNIAVESFQYLKKSHGQLLLYTSSSYTRGRALYSIYSSTKAAVVNFMQAISQEWESDGIRVNVMNPERTKTPMRVRNFGNEPEGTLLDAASVAEASLKTLLSDLTGQVFDVRIKK
ncbi:MAG: bifunctional cytidylyltransferase/SDR family oxidoreductase [Bacteroidaceae bacterium]|nr:bifunctional cytidylyltransferase/SDR family oxidoreductase [Bacteroidaceae bacterium]